ncbi:MAG: N-acetylmuramoyl-L-alanine amidase [bacterium]
MKTTPTTTAILSLFVLLTCVAFAQNEPARPISRSEAAVSSLPVLAGFPPPFVRPIHPSPTKFDERWQKVRPRTPYGVYPNEPADWVAMSNPRYAVPDGQPLKGLKICVDAGHGGQTFGSAHGYTGGTRGTNTGFSESDANLRTAFFLWDLLTQAGAEVTMTRLGPNRMSDAYTSPPGTVEFAQNRRTELYSRVQIAEQAGCDYFICIHHNAGRNNYVSCYYFDTSLWDDGYRARAPFVKRYPDEELTRESYQMTLEVEHAMSRTLNLRVIDPATEWANDTYPYFGHGVPTHDIVVMRESKIPVVLCEISMMTNPEEDLRLNDPARAKQAAKGMFSGILSYFKYHPMQKWSERPLAGPPAAK